MKIACTREDLMAGLETVQNAVSTKGTLPVLSNVVVAAHTENTIRLIATDLELLISCVVPAEVVNPGGVTLPAKMLTEYVGSLNPKSPVSIEVTEVTKAVVRSGRSRCSMMGLPLEDFPTVPEFDAASSFTADSHLFAEVLRRVAFSSSSDETRYVLNGVHLSLVDKAVRAAATDGRRLAFCQVMGDIPHPAMSAIVPNKAVDEYLRILGSAKQGEMISVSIKENSIAFLRGGVMLTSRVIEGNYPHYEQIIPTNSPLVVTMPRAELFMLTKRVALAAEQSSIISVTFDANVLRLMSHSNGRTEIEDELPLGQSVSPAVKFAINGNSLMEILKAIDSDDVEVAVTPSTDKDKPMLDPVVVRPAKSTNVVYVVLPLRV